MSGYRGPRKFIIELVDEEPVMVRQGRWEQRVKLECGHEEKLFSVSKHHRRARPVKYAFCPQCLPKER